MSNTNSGAILPAANPVQAGEDAHPTQTPLLSVDDQYFNNHNNHNKKDTRKLLVVSDIDMSDPSWDHCKIQDENYCLSEAQFLRTEAVLLDGIPDGTVQFPRSWVIPTPGMMKEMKREESGRCPFQGCEKVFVGRSQVNLFKRHLTEVHKIVILNYWGEPIVDRKVVRRNGKKRLRAKWNSATHMKEQTEAEGKMKAEVLTSPLAATAVAQQPSMNMQVNRVTSDDAGDYSVSVKQLDDCIPASPPPQTVSADDSEDEYINREDDLGIRAQWEVLTPSANHRGAFYCYGMPTDEEIARHEELCRKYAHSAMADAASHHGDEDEEDELESDSEV